MKKQEAKQTNTNKTQTSNKRKKQNTNETKNPQPKIVTRIRTIKTNTLRQEKNLVILTKRITNTNKLLLQTNTEKHLTNPPLKQTNNLEENVLENQTNQQEQSKRA